MAKKGTYLRPRNISLFRVEGKANEISIFNLESQKLYRLPGPSAYLYLLLDGSQTESEVLIEWQKDLAISNCNILKTAPLLIEILLKLGFLEKIHTQQKKKRWVHLLDKSLIWQKASVIDSGAAT